jgi:hypothetical protein
MIERTADDNVARDKFRDARDLVFKVIVSTDGGLRVAIFLLGSCIALTPLTSVFWRPGRIAEPPFFQVRINPSEIYFRWRQRLRAVCRLVVALFSASRLRLALAAHARAGVDRPHAS